jgi:hypothetical protein
MFLLFGRRFSNDEDSQKTVVQLGTVTVAAGARLCRMISPAPVWITAVNVSNLAHVYTQRLPHDGAHWRAF